MLVEMLGELVKRLLALLSSVASIGGLLIAFFPSPANLPWWGMALLLWAGFSLILLFALEIMTFRGPRVFAKSDSEGIKLYMHDWIQHGGRVAIWTRDMSWAQNADTRRLLKKKAERNELILCLPEPNPLSSELGAAGAEVCAYGVGRLGSPASRFTIAFFGRDGSRVAVGRADGETHVIEEFDARMHPAFHMAQDLIEIVRGQNAERQAE